MRRLAWAVAGLALLMCGGQARAALITYSFQGTGSGTVGGTPFVSAPFAIDVFADTENIVPVPGSPGTVFVDADRATLTLAGVGTGDFLIGTRVFNNQPNAILGFSGAGPTGLDLLDIANPAFATYDLSTSFGPVFAPTPFFIRLLFIPTSLGTVTFASAQNITFQATLQTQAVPEPSTLALLGLGAAGLLGYGRRRKRVMGVG